MMLYSKTLMNNIQYCVMSNHNRAAHQCQFNTVEYSIKSEEKLTHLRTGINGPKVSSRKHSMSVVTLDSSVGCMKDPSSLFPPFSTTAPCETASVT